MAFIFRSQNQLKLEIWKISNLQKSFLIENWLIAQHKVTVIMY